MKLNATTAVLGLLIGAVLIGAGMAVGEWLVINYIGG